MATAVVCISWIDVVVYFSHSAVLFGMRGAQLSAVELPKKYNREEHPNVKCFIYSSLKPEFYVHIEYIFMTSKSVIKIHFE